MRLLFIYNTIHVVVSFKLFLHILPHICWPCFPNSPVFPCSPCVSLFFPCFHDLCVIPYYPHVLPVFPHYSHVSMLSLCSIFFPCFHVVILFSGPSSPTSHPGREYSRPQWTNDESWWLPHLPAYPTTNQPLGELRVGTSTVKYLEWVDGRVKEVWRSNK